MTDSRRPVDALFPEDPARPRRRGPLRLLGVSIVDAVDRAVAAAGAAGC
jgi:hypothetical protein